MQNQKSKVGGGFATFAKGWVGDTIRIGPLVKWILERNIVTDISRCGYHLDMFLQGQPT
jgi:hypothetical protein